MPAPRPSFALTVLLFCLAVAGGAWWAFDDLKAWLVPTLARAVHTSGIPAQAVRCTLPTEHEQMVIVLWWDKGQLRTRCQFVGSRGTYSRPAPKGTAR